MGGGLIAYALFIAYRRHYPAGKPVSGREIVRRFVSATWGLMAPVIILGGIFSGVFTPSEAAAIASSTPCWWPSSCTGPWISRSSTPWSWVRRHLRPGHVHHRHGQALRLGTGLLPDPEAIAKAVLGIAGSSPFLIYLMVSW
jgi:C4-dicarboxylate transporter DctM subunit